MFLEFIASTIFLAVVVKFAIWWITEGNNDHWEKLGIPSVLLKEFTTYTNLLTGKTLPQDLDLYYYNKHKDAPFVGVLEFRSPRLMVRDLDLAKRIYVKDFDHFVNRRKIPIDHEVDDKFLFTMEGQDWKDLRSVMGPTFTSGKLRRMFEYFERSGEDLLTYVENQKRKTGRDSINLRDMYGRLVMDLIASTAFGVDGKCLKEDDSPFMKHGSDLVKVDFLRVIRSFMFMFGSGLPSFLQISILPPEPPKFFKSVLRKVLAERKQNPGNHKDFIQLMLEANNSNTVTKSSSEDSPRAKYQITDENILANGIIFVLAGFEGTESLMSLATYYCAINPDMQTRLREEIECALEESQGKISYDVIMKMEYLDMFISEVMRLNPTFTRTERSVTKAYQLPDSKVTLPVGTFIVLPVLGFHRDEKYFPEPEKFNPEHFSAENKANRHPYAYMPFGHGPRNCIGDRYALIEAKTGLIQILKNFEVLPSADTHVPLRFEPGPNSLKAVKELGVELRSRF